MSANREALREALIAHIADAFWRTHGQAAQHADALIVGPLKELIADAAEAENLRIAFLVVTGRGHGGGMSVVRKWFAAGATGPIPWPPGALFAAWAEKHGICDRNGAMSFRTRGAELKERGGGQS